jgi:predicted glycosyltransferase
MLRANRSSLRLALFTHDAFGLGHVRRSTRILRAVAEAEPGASLLLVTGSPSTHLLRRLPEGADYLKIPTITTSGAKATKPPTLNLSAVELAALRGEITRRSLAAFQPDVFLVDNFPLGTRHELLPVLQDLRGKPTKTVLGLRDVVDPPEKVRKDWAKQGVHDVIERLYDRVIVYGSREVLDASEAYELSDRTEKKLRYAGYVTEKPEAIRPAAELLAELGLDTPPLVGTVGGGGDGRPLLEAFIGAAAERPGKTALAITGELMSPKDREAVRACAAAAPNVRVLDHHGDLPSLMAAAELVVAMGGYNTSAEILAVGARAVVVPRSWRSGEHGDKGKTGVDGEQAVRAEGLARTGLVATLDATQLSPQTLGTAMDEALSRPRPESRPELRLDGADRVAELLLELAGS